MNFLGEGITDFDSAEGVGTFFLSSIAAKLNKFIFQNVSVLRGIAFAHTLVEGIGFHLGHKIDFLGSPLGKKTVVVIGSIIDDHGSRGKGDLAGNPDIGNFPFGNPGKAGQIAVMVQEKMELNSSFGLAEKSPVKETDRQINEGGVQADQLIFEAELFLPDPFFLEPSQKHEENVLKELPRPVFVGIGQGGVAGGGNAQMFQFALTSA